MVDRHGWFDTTGRPVPESGPGAVTREPEALRLAPRPALARHPATAHDYALLTAGVTGERPSDPPTSAAALEAAVGAGLED